MAEYRKFSEEQKALANSINLVDYLRSQGETLIKSGREFRWQRYTSVTIRDNYWYKHKTQEGGYPVKFLEEFYGMNYRDAVELLLSYANDTGITVDSNLDQDREIKEFALPERSQDMRRAYAYLLKTRFLDKEVIDEFVKDGLIYEDAQYHNVVFAGADEDGIAKHAHKKSTYTDQGRSYRGNVEGSDPRFSFHYKGTGNQLLVFEAPIDMLSYISIHKDNWKESSYVALCGLGMQAMDEMLEENPSITFVNLGADHDVAGSEGVERMIDHLNELGYNNVGIAKPQYKDFNEDLKATYGIEVEQGKENPNYALVHDMIEELQSQAIPDAPIEHRVLSKAFADMYYGLNHDGQNDPVKLKEDFQKITSCALQLEHQYVQHDAAFTANSEVYDYLLDDYKSYQDKGTLKNRIESIKNTFQNVKLTLDGTKEPLEIGKAYRKLANESFMMITNSERELLKQQQQKQVVTQKRPKAPIIGADGNIFNLMGFATRVLKKAGMEKEANDLFQKITSSGSYDEALCILMEYVEPVEVMGQEQNEGQQMI